jgi:CheY-like chemotaxis protein
MLKSAGFDVVPFAAAEEAVAWFSENAQAVRFTVADIMLPEMDGVEMVERLREVRSDLPVIWMSGFISPHIKKPPETDPVLIKPFMPADFMRSIEDVEGRCVRER